MTLGQSQARLTRAGVPGARGTVATGGDDLQLILRVGCGQDSIRVAVQDATLERANLSIARDAPFPDRPVMRGRQDARAIGQERRRLDLPPMSPEGLQHLPASEVPDADGVVLAAAEQQGTIG